MRILSGILVLTDGELTKLAGLCKFADCCWFVVKEERLIIEERLFVIGCEKSDLNSSIMLFTVFVFSILGSELNCC